MQRAARRKRSRISGHDFWKLTPSIKHRHWERDLFCWDFNKKTFYDSLGQGRERVPLIFSVGDPPIAPEMEPIYKLKLWRISAAVADACNFYSGDEEDRNRERAWIMSDDCEEGSFCDLMEDMRASTTRFRKLFLIYEAQSLERAKERRLWEEKWHREAKEREQKAENNKLLFGLRKRLTSLTPAKHLPYYQREVEAEYIDKVLKLVSTEEFKDALTEPEVDLLKLYRYELLESMGLDGSLNL